jgi:hypothetical protein
MNVHGSKQLSFQDRKAIYRIKPKDLRYHSNNSINQYKKLILSMTRNDYIEYEKLLHTWGTQGRKRQIMFDKCIELNISGPKLELARIRVNDLYAHQKIMGVIRNRWTKIHDIKKEQLNANPDKLWWNMARTIQKRCETEGYELYSEWHGLEGRQLLVDFLKKLFDDQTGLCAISRESIILQHSTRKSNSNKCSPDRKNSNKGYTPDNIWLVTWWVNAMKMDMSLITFWKRIDQLAKIRELNKHGKRKQSYK